MLLIYYMISYVGVEAQMDQLDKLIATTVYTINPATGLPYPAGFVQTADGNGSRTYAMVPPTGTITLYGGLTAPPGWLLCTGAAVSQATYAALYAVIGSIFGQATATEFILPSNGQLPGLPVGIGIYIIKY